MINPNRIANNANNKQFRCFFGLFHVRTACICIGTWHLVSLKKLFQNIQKYASSRNDEIIQLVIKHLYFPHIYL